MYFKISVAAAALAFAVILFLRRQQTVVAPPEARMALVTMVRNESHIIQRMLTSVQPHVDWIIVCDTDEASDGGATSKLAVATAAAAMVTTACAFIDFSTTRNCCLQQARVLAPEADFFLTLDADHELVLSAAGAAAEWKRGLNMSVLHYIAVKSGPLFYALPYLIPARAGTTCGYVGVTHEIYTCPSSGGGGGGTTSGRISRQALHVLHHGDGGNRAQKLTRDARLLEKALAEPPPLTTQWLRARYIFYLARTYDAALQWTKANALYAEYLQHHAYIDRQQTYVVRQRVAEMWQQFPNATRLFAEAAETNEHRAEPWVLLARIARTEGLYQVAALYMQQAKTKQVPFASDDLFVDVRYYYTHKELGWIAREEDALALYYTGHIAEARAAWAQILHMRELPADVRARVQNNAKRY